MLEVREDRALRQEVQILALTIPARYNLDAGCVGCLPHFACAVQARSGRMRAPRHLISRYRVAGLSRAIVVHHVLAITLRRQYGD